MRNGSAPAKNVNEYLMPLTEEVQEILQELRETILKAAPEAEEVISYAMPAYNYHGKLVYFAAWKTHVGFYPTSSGTAAFKKELSAYKTSKGAIQFPLSQPLPLALIAKIVKFRLKENKEKEKAKRKK